ncbi:MAG: PAS domain-containing protein [Cyclobacteriaceae bacterium]|nr:PAS domain-containing protein [Cyclobacteriaceae bacterium]
MNAGKKLKVLFIEDNEDDFLLITRRLRQDNLDIEAHRVDSSEALHKALCAQRWDVVVSDNNVPDRKVSIPSSLMATRKLNPNTPFIIVSGTIGEESAVNYMRLGASDYILKDNLGRLAPSIQREVNESFLRQAKTESESKLKESESNFRHLAESITDMFFAIDKDYRCTYWNKAAERLTHIPAAQAVNAHIFELIPKKLDREIRKKFINSLIKKVPDHIEFEYYLGEKKRYYETFIYPSEDLYSIIIRDVSEQKQIESQLNAANRELETFMYRVAHDIRGPVASLSGLIETVRHEAIDPVSKSYFAQASVMVDKLERSLRALQVITSIKLEDLQHECVKVSEILVRLKEKYQTRDFEINLQLQELPALVSDNRYVQMVMEHIIQNASVFRSCTRKAVLDISYKLVGKKLQLVFEDNGEGMTPDVQENIFNMFYRGSQQSTGEGLGLYLTRSLLDKLGGSIHVQSKYDVGSVFTIQLPLE